MCTNVTFIYACPMQSMHLHIHTEWEMTLSRLFVVRIVVWLLSFLAHVNISNVVLSKTQGNFHFLLRMCMLFNVQRGRMSIREGGREKVFILRLRTNTSNWIWEFLLLLFLSCAHMCICVCLFFSCLFFHLAHYRCLCLICQLFLHNIWLLDSHWQENK